MDRFQDRLTGAIRAFADDAELYEVAAFADDLAARACAQLQEEVVPALHRLAEDSAAGSRDFGRGYSLAMRDVAELISVQLRRQT